MTVSGYYVSDPQTMARMKGAYDTITNVFKSKDEALRSNGNKMWPGEYLYSVTGRLSVDSGSTMSLYLESYRQC